MNNLILEHEGSEHVFISRIHRYVYHCGNGLMRGAKIYLPRKISEKVEGRLMIVYAGLMVGVSVAKASKHIKKAYLPKKLRDVFEGYDALIVSITFTDDEAYMEIIKPTYICSICGSPTSNSDRLCFQQHFLSDNLCRRCGKAIEKGILCDECFSRYSQALSITIDVDTPVMVLEEYE